MVKLKLSKLNAEQKRELIEFIDNVRHSGRTSWGIIAKALNDTYNWTYDHTTYRKAYYRWHDQFALDARAEEAEFKASGLSDYVFKLKVERHKTKQHSKSINAAAVKAANFELANEALIEVLDKKYEGVPFLKRLNVATDTDNGVTGIVILTDQHYGKRLSMIRNSKDILDARTQRVMDRVMTYSNLLNVDTNILLNLGDITEHQDMRGNQYDEIDMEQAKQIEAAYDHCVKSIDYLSQFGDVRWLPISPGNHDRMNGSFKNATKDNTAANLINSLVEKTFRNTGDFNYPFDKIDDHIFTFEVNGIKFAYSHGDKTIKNGKNLKDDTNRVYPNAGIDCIFTGHFHTFNHKAGHVSCPALIGADSYARKLGYYDKPGAVYVVVQPNGHYDVHYIQLDDNDY